MKRTQGFQNTRRGEAGLVLKNIRLWGTRREIEDKKSRARRDFFCLTTWHQASSFSTRVASPRLKLSQVETRDP